MTLNVHLPKKAWQCLCLRILLQCRLGSCSICPSFVFLCCMIDHFFNFLNLKQQHLQRRGVWLPGRRNWLVCSFLRPAHQHSSLWQHFTANSLPIHCSFFKSSTQVVVLFPEKPQGIIIKRGCREITCPHSLTLKVWGEGGCGNGEVRRQLGHLENSNLTTWGREQGKRKMWKRSSKYGCLVSYGRN